ncbi:MAG: LysR family transcriptional regulator [Bacteroidetes bacterium]|nr:LysR family transcriptional regulator [Bacteroidota bacterium]
MLNLEWFRTFKAIYETGNLSNAAQALFISQPGVSLHLNSLEAYTGYRLFERETRKMIPTERGTILYNCIVDPMNRLTEAEDVFCRNSDAGKPTLSVGLGFETFEYSLAEHIAQLPFNLIVRFGECPQMLHDLDTGALDLVLTSQKGPQPNLEYTPFLKEKLILICGARTDARELDHLIAADKQTAIREWLKKQIWYTTAADMGYLKNFWQANFDCQPDFKPNYVVPYFRAILRCLRNGTGFAIMPDFLCKNELEQKTIRIAWEGSPQLENTLHFGKRKKTRYALEIRQLEQILNNSINSVICPTSIYNS